VTLYLFIYWLLPGF